MTSCQRSAGPCSTEHSGTTAASGASTQLLDAIGGYFELELAEGTEYHADAIRLNTGRNAFEYILRARGCRKVYLPYYTSDAMLEPIPKLGIEHEFYHIDENLEPCLDCSDVEDDAAFVYTNYYGLKDRCVETLAQTCPNLIVDNAQAFFAKPVPGTDSFYSPRKFFGLPDGAYLYSNALLDIQLEQDCSDERCSHLLVRTDHGAEAGYPCYVQNNRRLSGVAIKKMSNLTQRLLGSIDYHEVSKRRRTNFLMLHEELGSLNGLRLQLADESVPMVYPLYVEHSGLRQHLVENRIYVAQYWPNVVQWTEQDDLERDYAENIVPLPIDQRYSASHMCRIVAAVRSYCAVTADVV